MDSPGHPWLLRKGLDFLVGVETGVLGGLAMLVWFAFISLLTGHEWWTIPNLFASEAYHRGVTTAGPGWNTLSGSALHLSIAGVVGGIAGLFTPGGRLFGLGIAIVWYVLSVLFLWKRFAPLVPIHVHYAVLMTAYFVYGSILGLHSSFRRELGDATKVQSRITNA